MPSLETIKTLPSQYKEVESNWNNLKEGNDDINIRSIPLTLVNLIAKDLKAKKSLSTVQFFLLKDSTIPTPSHLSQIEGVSFEWAKKTMEGMAYVIKGSMEKKSKQSRTESFLQRLQEIDSSSLASRKFVELSRDVFSGTLQVPAFFECSMPNTLSLQTRQWTTALCMIQTELT